MSTQDQNTPQQKDARPIWARRCAKATAEAVQPQHYTRADMLKQSNIWFRKQGVPLIIPARQRALEAFPRSVPWILWAGIMHICYIFLRDILLLVVEDVKGSLPNYIKALTSDSALSNEVLPVLVLGGIFLVMPVISGVFIALAHVLMVRIPRWVQITTGILTVLFAGILFTAGVFASSTLDGLDFVYDGSQVFPLIVVGIYLAIFLGIDTILGWSFKHAIHQLASLPPMIAKVLPVLMVSVLFIFVNADLWKLANGLSFPRTWAVLGLMGLYSPCSWSSQPPWSAQRACWGAPEATTSHALVTTTTSMPQPSKAESGTPPKTGSKSRKSSNTDPSKSRPGATSSSSP